MKAIKRLAVLFILLASLLPITIFAQTYTWSNAASLATGRDFHTASVLQDGRVLVVGGQANTNSALSSAEIYNPSTDTWSATNPLAAARFDHTATVLADGRVLVAGGEGTPYVVRNTAEIYNPATGTWSATATAMNSARTWAVATLLADGRVLVAGGFNGFAFLNTAEIYDPVANTWTSTPIMNSNQRARGVATLLTDGKVLVSGGATGASTNTAEIYDPVANTWTLTTNTMSNTRYNHTATMLADETVLVAGGTDGPTIVATVDIYNPTTNTWSATTPMNVARSQHTASMLSDGRVLVASGSTAEIYDPSGSPSPTWNTTGGMNHSHVEHTASVLANGQILVVAGVNSIPNAELFDGPPPPPVVSGANGGDGPGGVGSTNGSTNLNLWLNGNKDTYTNSGCTTATASTNPVACWKDQSGNNQNFTQTLSGEEPAFQTAILNGQAVVRFDGTDDNLQRAAFAALNGQNDYTLFLIGSASAAGQDILAGVDGIDNHGLLLQSEATNNLRFLHRMPFAASGGDNLITTGGNFAFGSAQLLSFVRDTTNSSQAILFNGTNIEWVVPTGIAMNQNINLVLGQINTVGGRQLNGDIAELVIYSSALNGVERILVENYLSAKYNLPLDANDVYDGDTPGNGDFDLDVAGIGQDSLGNQHTQAHAAGMIVVDNNFLNDNGDWLLFGHKTAVNANDNNAAELPSTGDWMSAPAPMRWLRHFYINVTDAAGTDCSTAGTCFVDIIFDYSEGGMDGDPAKLPTGAVSNYRLLKRTLDSGPFSDIATATAIVGDQVQFLNVDVSLLGSNFTLGTLDASNSPTAVSMQSFSTTSNAALLPILIATLLLVLMGSVALRRRSR